MSAKKWKSIFCDKLIGPAQYLTELVCENKARREGKDLEYRFWQSTEGQKWFKSQVWSAAMLLKKYDVQHIIKALKTKQGKKVTSLRAKFLIPLIEEQKELAAKLVITETQLDIAEKDEVPPQDIKVNKALNKLKELD